METICIGGSLRPLGRERVLETVSVEACVGSNLHPPLSVNAGWRLVARRAHNPKVVVQILLPQFAW